MASNPWCTQSTDWTNWFGNKVLAIVDDTLHYLCIFLLIFIRVVEYALLLEYWQGLLLLNCQAVSVAASFKFSPTFTSYNTCNLQKYTGCVYVSVTVSVAATQLWILPSYKQTHKAT